MIPEEIVLRIADARATVVHTRRAHLGQRERIAGRIHLGHVHIEPGLQRMGHFGVHGPQGVCVASAIVIDQLGPVCRRARVAGPAGRQVDVDGGIELGDQILVHLDLRVERRRPVVRVCCLTVGNVAPHVGGECDRDHLVHLPDADVD